MTARGTMETVMAATRGGAFDYIAKPFDLDRMLETVKRAEASRIQETDEVEPEEMPETEMIGSSTGMVEIYKTVSRVAPTDATVLIEGETGTGKELVARMIHRNSPRASQPFVPVDCASIAPTLLESELFGASRARTPAPTATAWACSKPRTTAPCSWTKSATSSQASS